MMGGPRAKGNRDEEIMNMSKNIVYTCMKRIEKNKK